jgi:hypothetical protein
MMHLGTRLLILATLATCCGCNGSSGPKLMPTSGVVRYHGKPLAGARVIFNPEHGRPAQATTDAEGRFQLSTLHPADGAVVGTHQVAVIAPRSGVERMPGPNETPVPEPVEADALPKRYGDPQTSGLEREVKAEGKNEITLDLE